MQLNQKIADKLRSMTKGITTILTGTVTALDDAAFTIDVLPTISGDDESLLIPAVQLNGITESDEGMIIFPAIGSDVIIGVMDGGGEHILLKASKIDKVSVMIGDTSFTITSQQIQMNNGGLGGLPVIGKVNENFNTIKDYIKQTLEPAIANGFTAVGAGAAANGATGASTFNTAVSGQVITIKDMENTKIKQG